MNETPRQICPIIFIFETSGCMSGAPIGAVNAAMVNVLPELTLMNNDSPTVEIKIAVMTFGSFAKWITPGLVDPGSCQWNGLNVYTGCVMGAAFKELNRVLSVSHGFMNHESGYVAPVLFLLSEDQPTDNYQYELQALKKNNWYKVAAKVAICYGYRSNDSVLLEFTGNVETVLHTDDPEDLPDLIKFVTITASQVASTGNGVVTPGNAARDMHDRTEDVAQALQTAPPKLASTDDNW